MLIRTLHRISTLALVAALCFVVSASEAPAAPSKADALRQQLNQLNAEAARAGKAYDSAYWSLDVTEGKIAKTEKAIATHSEQLAAVRVRLGKRLEAQYRTDEMGVLGFILGSDDFGDFVTRLDLIQRVAQADADVIVETEVLVGKLAREKIALETEQEQQAVDVAAFRKQRDALQARLKRTRAQYDAVQAQLTAEVRKTSGTKLAKTAVSVPGPNGMVFPVAGPCYYSDTWGASRGGGRRRHKGTDIMAATGTPVVAVLSGTVSTKSGATSGLFTTLRADNGWQFWYMHLDSFAVRSGRVSAGQVIGYVGYSGNASRSAPHLHFEIHPGGGGAVNPYPYLRKMQGR